MSDLGSTSGFYASRPTVSVDGQENTGLSEGLLTLLVEETCQGLYRCEATFGNWGTYEGEVDFLYFDRSVLEFGKSISVRAGDGDTEADIFQGYVMGLEAHYPQKRPPEILVLAEDRFQDLRMTRRTRSFEEVSDRDVLDSIASDHGLQTDIDIDGPTYRVLTQVNQSDLAFLRDRARAVDAELWFEANTLHAQSRSRRRADTVTLSYGQGLIEFSVTADLAGQRSRLSVSGWDVSSKETISHTAEEAAIRSELNGFQSGSAILKTAFGDREDQLVHKVPLTPEEARHLAEAQFRRTARQFVRGRGICQGDGRIRVGAVLDLQGLGRMFSGEYYAAEVRHTFNPQMGFQTHFSVERPGIQS